MAGYTLGPRWGFFAMCVYIVAGLAGLPIFANLNGGLNVLAKPTAGYLLSFPFAAYAVGFVNRNISHNITAFLFSALAANAIIYVFGVFWLTHWSTHIAAKPLSFGTALKIGVIPFLPFDFAKALAAYYINTVFEKHMRAE